MTNCSPCNSYCTCIHVLFNSQVLDCLADGVAFGALEACKECKGQLVFKGDAYYCTGDISAWTKCVFKTATPIRKDWVIPKVGLLISGLFLVLYIEHFHAESPPVFCENNLCHFNKIQ